jgi:hypothetical protein
VSRRAGPVVCFNTWKLRDLHTSFPTGFWALELQAESCRASVKFEPNPWDAGDVPKKGVYKAVPMLRIPADEIVGSNAIRCSRFDCGFRGLRERLTHFFSPTIPECFHCDGCRDVC